MPTEQIEQPEVLREAAELRRRNHQWSYKADPCPECGQMHTAEEVEVQRDVGFDFGDPPCISNEERTRRHNVRSMALMHRLAHGGLGK